MKLKRTQELTFVQTDDSAEFDNGDTILVLQTYECNDWDEQNCTEPFDIFNVGIEVKINELISKTIDLLETTDWRLAKLYFENLKSNMVDVRR